jgi:hypothetical protein
LVRQLLQLVVACLVPLLLQPVEALVVDLDPQLPQPVAACLVPLLQPREALAPLLQRAEDCLVPQLPQPVVPLEHHHPRVAACLVLQPPHLTVPLQQEALVLLLAVVLELLLQLQEDSLDRQVLHQEALVVMELRLLAVCLVVVQLVSIPPATIFPYYQTNAV